MRKNTKAWYSPSTIHHPPSTKTATYNLERRKHNERTTEEQTGGGADSGADGLHHGTHDSILYECYPCIIAAPYPLGIPKGDACYHRDARRGSKRVWDADHSRKRKEESGKRRVHSIRAPLSFGAFPPRQSERGLGGEAEGRGMGNLGEAFVEQKETSDWVSVTCLLCGVIPSGFEPEAYCLEGSCSIQLSYGTPC